MKKLKLMTSIVTLSLLAGMAIAQENEVDEESATTAIRGRIVQNLDKAFEIDLGDLQAELQQQPELPQPPLPKDWAELKAEQRQSWIEEFEASEAGKAFLAERQKIIESAKKFKLPLEDDGKFIVYDVPVGSYGLFGQTEKQVDQKKYVLEIFGHIDVSKDVEEILLDPMMVSVTRLLSSGETLSDFEIEAVKQKSKINRQWLANSTKSGQHFLFSFWTVDPPNKAYIKELQKACASLKDNQRLQWISVCVGSNAEDAKSAFQELGTDGWQGYVSEFENELTREFGLRAFPSLLLVNSKLQIVLTDEEIRQRSSEADAQLENIISAAITEGE